MILKKYGIELHSISHNDIEKIRTWRNSEDVVENMFYREQISVQLQEEWFESLNESDCYLMIVYRSEQIGVVNVKKIDWSKRSGEAGVFIGEKEYYKSIVPMLAILCMMDAFFETFSFSALTARVRKENQIGLNFNFELGYKVVGGESDQLVLRVTEEDYLNAAVRIKKTGIKFGKQPDEINLSTEETKLLLNQGD
ncbi:MAG: UDP-4-amino-4,6-dideoxy-N-acetyl-beta-L-altrosamine N-acetyltransferase [Flavobacteriaceae bacterium]|jgi:UDP-4-amino-4,6-dideoxy-N-acetyl-beta-L-altrosamine N-acetyltransferase